MVAKLGIKRPTFKKKARPLRVRPHPSRALRRAGEPSAVREHFAFGSDSTSAGVGDEAGLEPNVVVQSAVETVALSAQGVADASVAAPLGASPPTHGAPGLAATAPLPVGGGEDLGSLTASMAGLRIGPSVTSDKLWTATAANLLTPQTMPETQLVRMRRYSNNT